MQKFIKIPNHLLLKSDKCTTQTIPTKRFNEDDITPINSLKKVIKSMFKSFSIAGENTNNLIKQPFQTNSNIHQINLLVSNNKYIIPNT